MNLRHLRSFGFAVFSFLTIASYAAADRDTRVSELEHQMKQVGTDTPMGTFGANTAPARPEVDGRKWFISLEALFWKAKAGGTQYAYTDQDPVATVPIRGKQKGIDFDWDWGLRFGLGYNLEHDNWDIRAEYTWWETDGSDSVSAGLNSSVVPLRGSSQLTTSANGNQTVGPFLYCSKAKSLYDLDYQAVDVELGRDYYISSTVSFRPFWGLKSAWIDQDQKTRYTGGSVTTDGGPFLGLEGNTVHVKESSDFWGLGPRVGLDTRWYMGNNFSIFGNVSGALLFGHFDVHHKEYYSGTPDARISIRANRHAFAPTAQFQLGMQYDTYVHHDQHHISLGLGFETQYWWRQNQMLKVDDAAALKFERYSEDIAFYGATATFVWNF